MPGAQDLPFYKKKRGTFRTLTTKLVNGLDSELQKERPDEQVVEDYLSQIKPKEGILKTLDADIERLIEDDAFDAELVQAQEYLDRLHVIVGRANNFLNKSRQVQLNPVSSDILNASFSGTTISESPVSTAPKVHLPKLQIPKFKGDVSKWQAFWSHYETSIHLNASISNSVKFCYLKTYLEGPAALAIEGLSLSGENYESAVNILTTRFGRKEIIINTHMNQLLSLSPVKRSNDLDALRKLYDSIEVQLRSLESLGVECDTYGSLLCPVLMKLLPEDIAIAFSREKKSEINWKVNDLCDYLRDEIASRERALAIIRPEESAKTSQQNSDQRHTVRTGNQKSSYSSAAALSSGTTFEKRPCVFCDETSHFSGECRSVPVEERRKIALQKKLCFICLREGHQAGRCRRRTHTCKACKKHHHRILCDYDQSQTTFKSTDGASTAGDSNGGAAMSSLSTSQSKGVILLQTASCLVTDPENGNTKKLRCLMDSGSHLSYIKTDVSRSLHLQVIGEETLNIHSFGSSQPVRTRCKKVRLQLQSTHNPTRRIAIEAYETPDLCGAVFTAPTSNIVNQMTTMGLEIADRPAVNHCAKSAMSIEILIGSDYYWEVASPGRTHRLGESLVALETVLGWTVQGPTYSGSSPVGTNTIAVMRVSTEEDQLSSQMRAFWELDAIGINDADNCSSEALSSEILKSFEKSITMRDGRYEVSFPWKSNKEDLGDNRLAAKKRTSNLLYKMRQDPALFQCYNDVLKDQLSQGIIEEVDEQDHVSDNPVYYLPHRAVIRESSATTRLRIVYDASSHAKDVPALNNCLESGPNLNPELFDVLLRFREKKVAFSADIEKAFLQIAIAEKDRDAVRFYWVDVNHADPASPMKTFRFARVPFGVTASPFLLAATIRFHGRKFEKEQPLVAELLNHGLYVDDVISSADSVDHAYQLSTTAAEVLQEGGMNLRKFRSNSTELCQRWRSRNPEEAASDQNLGPTLLKVLGLSWDATHDCLIFDIASLLEFLTRRQPTKRWVLRAVARVFDPIGFLSPFTVRAKMLFQELWEQGLSWDGQLPPTLAKHFDDWCEELSDLREIAIPRYYFNGINSTPSTMELHAFVDSSERAYAAVVYVRFEDKNGRIGTSLIASKTRIAPLKKLTLPRLELMGAVIGARLVNHLLKALTITPSNVRLWTDSMITLHWIRGSASKWKPFVSNRVREIQSLTDPQQWGHCKGKENPADLPTRGLKAKDFPTSLLWWKGPEWLSKPMDTEAVIVPQDSDVVSVSDELRSAFKDVAQALTIIAPATQPPLDLNHFSSWTKVTRITAWMLRFAKNARSRNPDDRQQGPLTAAELQAAEIFWIQRTQRDGFPDEHHRLCNKLPIASSSKIASLHPILDGNHLICVGGRIRSGNFSYQERHPWIIPHDHRIAELLVQYHHGRVMHAGINDTLVDIRTKFWIIRSRQLIKRVIRSCVICKRFAVKKSVATMAPLPSTRTTPAPPFEVCGIDFAGPLYSKTGDKCYLALFTCAVTRAVHLEIVSDLSTDKFLLAFRRFLARRGLVRIVYSDNAKTFKRAELDIKQLWKNLKSNEVREFIGTQQIEWRYIVDRAAWWGGFWERLVRSVKNALRKVLGQARLTHEELETTAAEVEAVINSRPISFVYQDPAEPAPMTPAHFLVGDRLTALPSQSFPPDVHHSATRDQLTRRLKYRQTLLDRFWTRWRNDYMLELRTAHHSLKSTPSVELKPGDVVLIEESRLPRLSWRTAIVEEAFKGRDNVVRSCLLRLSNGTKLKRPVQLLYNLELCC